MTVHLDETKKKNKNIKIIWRSKWKQQVIKFTIDEDIFLNFTKTLKFKEEIYEDKDFII